ncbi:MAG: hypothetical protein ACHQWU_02860 [Gemmatimonadales bacterium]
MRTLLAPAHLALGAIIVIWDIVLAGRIAQNRQSPRFFQAVSGLGALLLVPALLLTLATATLITGRAVAAMDWLWPAMLVLFAVQALYALLFRLVNPVWGIPIAIYDLAIALIGVVRYLVEHGRAVPQPFVVLLAAQSLAMVFVSGTSSALSTPFYLNIPMVSPAFPALHKLTASFRLFMTLVAMAWMLFIVVSVLPATGQLGNYARHRGDQIHDRADADLAVGVKILPDILRPPSPAAVRSDSSLLDTLGVGAVSVVVVPGASRLAIDSLARVLGPMRRDSAVVVVALGYRGKLVPELGPAPFNEAQRLVTLRLVIDRIRPDIVLPAEDPYTTGERAVGAREPVQWEAYLTRAARVAKSADPSIRVGVAASSYRTRDSTLYAWAAGPSSPIDVVGFSFFPSPVSGGGIQSDTRTADRWMRVMPPRKEHWVFGVGGYPLAFGERTQDDAVWEVLAWASDHPAIKGAIVYEAGDYGQARGLRAPNGRLRLAAGAVMRAIKALQESAR